MKITCLQENLAKGLATVGRAVATRSTLPVLSNILLESDDGPATIGRHQSRDRRELLDWRPGGRGGPDHRARPPADRVCQFAAPGTDRDGTHRAHPNA